jgi:hypothetical protein
MASKLKRAALYPVACLVSDKAGQNLARWCSRRLSKQLMVILAQGAVADEFLDILLKGMDLSLCLCRGYRRNIEGFRGTYLFRTADESVVAAAVFANGAMRVLDKGVENWDVRVTFRDVAALASFLLAPDRDLINAVLENRVMVDGNLNYIYKLGFMVVDLAKRFGVLPLVVGGS